LTRKSFTVVIKKLQIIVKVKTVTIYVYCFNVKETQHKPLIKRKEYTDHCQHDTAIWNTRSQM